MSKEWWPAGCGESGKGTASAVPNSLPTNVIPSEGEGANATERESRDPYCFWVRHCDVEFPKSEQKAKIVLVCSRSDKQCCRGGTKLRGHGLVAALLGTFLCVCSVAAPQEPSADSKNSQGRPPNSSSVPTTVSSADVLIPIKTKKPDYPLDAAHDGIQGQVRLRLSVSAGGDVDKAELISGDPVLGKAAIAAARQWKFKPKIENGKPVEGSTELTFDFYFKGKLMQGGQFEDKSATTDSPRNKPVPASSLSSDETAAMGTRTPIDVLPMRPTLSAGVAQGMLVHQVAPIYPPAARRDRIQGSVLLQAVIGKDGRIANLQAVSGPKQLIPAAVAAVQQWRYRPFSLNGEPVEVQTVITVNFQLR